MARVGRLFLLCSFAVFSFYLAGCHSTHKGDAGFENPGPQSVDSTLDKYSDQELRRFLANRRNKSLYDDSPADVKAYSDGQILDFMTYRQKTLYGTDRRIEFFDIQDPIQFTVANSVAALVDSDHYRETSTSYQLSGDTLGAHENLCAGEHFSSEPEIAFCTAFVVGPDLIATAGHCVPQNLESVRLVFGYRAQRKPQTVNDPQTITEIPKSQVYKISEVVKTKYDGDDTRAIDYAVMRVDRKIPDHLPLPLDTETGVAVNDQLYVVGFPMGLPMKLADRGIVRRVATEGYFVSNLDTFGGNSGSPVMRAGSLTVEGILVRGNNDFVYRGTCQVALVCARNRDCKLDGEDATSIKAIEDVFTTQKTAPSDAEAHPPITKTFSSGPVVSGTMKNFSAEYTLVSDPAPPGYKIANYDISLTGDRVCNAFSTCRATLEGSRVVFRFSLQGHDEWAPPGQATSVGNLVVTYEYVGSALAASASASDSAQMDWHTEDRNGNQYIINWEIDPACRGAHDAQHPCNFTHTQRSFAGDNTPYDHWDIGVEAPGPVTQVECQTTGPNEFNEVKGDTRGLIGGRLARCTGWINGGDFPIRMTVHYKMRW